MPRSLRRPLTRLLVAMLALGAMAAVPTVAQATTVTSGTFELLPHALWYTYLGIFGGATRATGSATLSGTNVLTTTFSSTGTTYAPDLTLPPISQLNDGRGALQFSGGIQWTLPAHFINLKLSDFKLDTTTAVDNSADLYATVVYDPYETSGPQVAALVNYGVLHIANVDLSGFIPGGTHTWNRAPLALTAAGALAFNGGRNGSYRDGGAFGSINVTATP